MPVEIREKMTFVLQHHTDDRMHGTAVVSRYKPGAPRLVKRPEDGSVPGTVRLRCHVCKDPLAYQVHSARSTARRQTRWLWLTWAGVALIGVGVFFLTSLAGMNASEADSGDYATIAVSVLAIVAGIAGAVVFGILRGNDDGVTGHRRSLPGVTKHVVSTRPPPD